MKVPIIKIGNSTGIEIPQSVLDDYMIKDEVELVLKNNEISLKPSRNPREGWSELFEKETRKEEIEEEKFSFIKTKFDDEDWEWK